MTGEGTGDTLGCRRSSVPPPAPQAWPLLWPMEHEWKRHMCAQHSFLSLSASTLATLERSQGPQAEPLFTASKSHGVKPELCSVLGSGPVRCCSPSPVTVHAAAGHGAGSLSSLAPPGTRSLTGTHPRPGGWPGCVGPGTSVRSPCSRGSGAPAGQTGRGVQDHGPSTQTSSAPTRAGHSLSDELDGIFILHPALDESQSHEDRSPGGRRRAVSPSLGQLPCPFPCRAAAQAQAQAFTLTTPQAPPWTAQVAAQPHHVLCGLRRARHPLWASGSPSVTVLDSQRESNPGRASGPRGGPDAGQQPLPWKQGCTTRVTSVTPGWRGSLCLGGPPAAASGSSTGTTQ